MRAGYVSLERVAPVVLRLIEERWPEGNGYSVLAEKVGMDESAIRRIADPPENKDSAEFDVVDKILCGLGCPFAWYGELADIYQNVVFVETCALPSCNRKFREKFNGRTRKVYCSSRCATLAHAVRDGRATGERLRIKGFCLKGHKMTPENTILKERAGRGTERQCRECKRITQRNWMRKKRQEPEFRERALERTRQWRAKA